MNIDRVIPGWQVPNTERMMFVFIVYFWRINHFDKSICVTCDLEDSEPGAGFVSNQAQGWGHEKRDIWCHDATMQRQKVIMYDRKNEPIFFHSPTEALFSESEYVRKFAINDSSQKNAFFHQANVSRLPLVSRPEQEDPSLDADPAWFVAPWFCNILGGYWVVLEEIYTNYIMFFSNDLSN